MEFHLKRETGRILRAVQMGSSSFVSILNLVVFQLMPIFIKLVMVCTTIIILYSYQFVLINLACMAIYFGVNYVLTEWRSKFFKEKSQKDQGYNQKAIDSLINFETVQYFNAEHHEKTRFFKQLQEFKDSQLKMVQSMKVQNTCLSLIILAGRTASLMLCYKYIVDGQLTVGDFVVFQMYI